MIYVNGKYLDPMGNDSYAEEYRALRKRLLSDEFQWPIVIKTRKTPMINPTGYVEPPQNVVIPSVSMIEMEFGTVEWRYTTGHPQVVNGVLQFPINRIFLNETTIIERDHIDLALYLIFKAKPGVSDGFLYLHDTRKEADEYAKNRARFGAVSYMLYDEDSPLSGSDIRTIALAFGISNADSPKYTDNEVKRLLEEAIINGETTGDELVNYKKFKEYSRVGEHVKQMAAVQKLYDNKIVEFDSTDGSFYLLDGNGARADKVFKISVVDIRKKDALFLKFLRENERMRYMLKEDYGVDVTGDTHSFYYEELMAMDMSELRKVAKTEGVESFGRKKDDIIADIMRKRTGTSVKEKEKEE